MGTPLPLAKSDMGCTLWQRGTVLQGFVDHSIPGEHINSRWREGGCVYGTVGTKASESWTCNTSSYFGNASTSEKYLPCAYAGNMRFPLSHSSSKVQKKKKKKKEKIQSAKWEQGGTQE